MAPEPLDISCPSFGSWDTKGFYFSYFGVCKFLLAFVNYDCKDGFIIQTLDYAVRPNFRCVSKIAECSMNKVSPLSRASDAVSRISESFR